MVAIGAVGESVVAPVEDVVVANSVVVVGCCCCC